MKFVTLIEALVATGFTALLILICILLVLVLPSLDPAIRWKERNERKKGKK